MNKIESEKLIEKNLCKEVKKIGGMAIKLLCNQFSGLPDRMCLFPNGIVVFVEVKTTGQKPRRLQTIVHEKIRALGFDVYIVDSNDKVDDIILKYRANNIVG